MIIMFIYFILLLLQFLIICYSFNTLHIHEDNIEYPKFIPIYTIRRDIYTKEEVQRGRLQLLGGLNRNNITNPKVTLKEFKQILQCSLHEPELNGRRGSLSFLKLAPITKSSIESVCAFLQTECGRWKGCHDIIPKLRKQPFESSHYLGSPTRVRLLRIINNELFQDWPFGEYQKEGPPNGGITEIIFSIISRISDIGNSVFTMGEEISAIPWYIPIPAFSCAPKLTSTEMPWPWYEAYSFEKQMFKNPNQEWFLYKFKNKDNWEGKIPKAAFYGTLRSDRQIFFDIASTRPDLFDAKWNSGGEGLVPWNPESDESRLEIGDTRLINSSNTRNEVPPKIGTLENILNQKLEGGLDYRVADYKFTVVLTGDAGQSTSGRLSILLAYSGSVVLIQDHDMAYTFTSTLKPWIHYVPISFTGSDIIEKIEYLIKHDHIAKRIALNAKNFAQSHLRYEDYLCYVAEALNAVSNITSLTDANIPFNATKIKLPINVDY